MLRRGAEKEYLDLILNFNLATIRETLKILEEAEASPFENVSCEEVVKMGDHVYKEATITGVLWTGENPELRAIEESIRSYFNILRGVILLSLSSIAKAGPTLSSGIQTSVKRIVDTSFTLMKESVFLYGSQQKDQKLAIPQLVGPVWEACSALQKTPATNVTAIGRAMTQVAVSMKAVLHEMKELKPGVLDPDDTSIDETPAKRKCEPHDDNSSNKGDLGNDLSPEEMKVAQLAIVVVSDVISVIKELIRFITGILNLESPTNDNSYLIASLEKLLKLCREIGAQIDEIGACLYPPQEVPVIKTTLEKVHSIIDDVQVELEGLKRASEAFLQACNVLRISMSELVSELSSSCTNDVEARIENITLNS